MSPTDRNSSRFVVATPLRSVCDNNARVLEKFGKLRFLALGTRRGTAGVPSEHTRLNPRIGLSAYLAARLLSPFQAENLRFRLLPWFDRWVLKQLQPGDHILSSFGYTNECFKFVRRHGGKTFLDAGNSHIENFWEIMTEEHRRWNCPTPPIPRHWYERTRQMYPEVDFVLAPSAYVANSFLARGFKPEQMLRNVYPVDLTLFQPSAIPRPTNRPLTLINTGSLSLRKGTPYLLEAFRLVRKEVPDARLLLTDIVQDDVRPLLAQYADLPIEWAPGLPHAKLAERLRNADVFVHPSLEEGLVRTVCEAMACGLQAVVTSHCGVNDFIQPGVDGEIVPIRDPQATAIAILKCWQRLRSGNWNGVWNQRGQFAFATFEADFVRQLQGLGLMAPTA